MPVLDSMSLKKLTIKVYTKKARTGLPIGKFEAMFNPASFTEKYKIVYGTNQGLNSTNSQLNYSFSVPREVSLKLILDGTGVQQMQILPFGNPLTVAEQVNKFVNLVFQMNGTTHEPNFLKIEWGGKEDGGLIFDCRLANLNVTYTSFNRDGSPLRAELDLVLISDIEPKKRLAKENKSSPDLTHSRIVKSGDTLPLLCKEIYGTSQFYIRVAQVNNLDDFRNIRPGLELIFPPLAS
jgi:hypothetical protein